MHYILKSTVPVTTCSIPRFSQRQHMQCVINFWVCAQNLPFSITLKLILMKPLQQYFRKGLFQLFVFYIALNFLSLWTKEYGVIIKMKPLQKLFHMVLFVSNKYVVLNFKPMGEILRWKYGRFVSLQSRFATSRLAAQWSRFAAKM